MWILKSTAEREGEPTAQRRTSAVDETADQPPGDETRLPATKDMAAPLEPNCPRMSGGSACYWPRLPPIGRTHSGSLLKLHARCCEDLQRRWLSLAPCTKFMAGTDSISPRSGYQHENPRHLQLPQAGSAACRSRLESWQTVPATRQPVSKNGKLLQQQQQQQQQHHGAQCECGGIWYLRFHHTSMSDLDCPSPVP
jgi:hypothetical protein